MNAAAPGIDARARPETRDADGVTVKIVPRRSGHAHLERAQPHHAREAETPTRELGKPEKAVTTRVHGHNHRGAESPLVATRSE